MSIRLSTFFLPLLLFASLANSQSEEQVEKYVNVIDEANQNAETRVLPTDNRRFYASGPRQYFGEFDFIIVGAGATGTVLANRISAIRSWKVLLIEAGGWRNDTSDIPFLFDAMRFTDFNWGYNSSRSKTSCLGFDNHTCTLPRGLGIGGTTLINGLLYSRGYKIDFDTWANLTNDQGWNWESALEHFIKTEDFHHNDPEAPYEPQYHGHDGELYVEYHSPKSPQLDLFLKANQELGFGLGDFNANELGASPGQFMTRKGRRFDNGQAFIEKIRNRTNLKILTGGFVTKVQIGGLFTKIASGVEFNYERKRYYAKASKEIILSGGAYGSAQILMLSGVGPKNHLLSRGIEVIEDLEVGTELYDNPTYFGLVFNTNYSEPVKPLSEYVREFLYNGSGPISVPGGLQGVGFYESTFTKGTGSPDIEILMFPANSSGPGLQRSLNINDQTYEDIWGNVNVTTALSFFIVATHTKSFGNVRLKSKSPYDFPIINTKWLSDPEERDVEILYQGIQLAFKLIQTKAFQSIDPKLAARPLRACKQFSYPSKKYWYCAIRQVTGSDDHPMSTCKMGLDPKKGAVLNSELKVFGIQNLRVADASVFPSPIAGHPVAPAVMIGDRLGDLVLEQYS